MDFEAVRKHFRPVSNEEADALALQHGMHPPVVVVDPDIMGGTPCLAGSRLPAQTLIDMVDAGDAWERIVSGWPWLTPAHVEAARAWLASPPAFPPPKWP